MKDQKRMIYWLALGGILIFIMVIVGGITRLTHSGLSITNYELISGTLPPLNEAAWNEAFELYKQYPEYQKINSDFTLEDFKDIFFWEWLHRLIGRVIGLVFIIPFLYFLIKKQLNKATIKKCLILLFLGGFQGFLGWYMVKSGLVDNPDVSHYRLAMHLITAFITFAYTLWVALDLWYPEKKPVQIGIRNALRIFLGLLIIQIVWGAFVAGLDAGWLHNHWPLMNDGKLIHETVTQELHPVWKNFVEGKSGVQFIHRYLVYVLLISAAFIWIKIRNSKPTSLQKKGWVAILIFLCMQFILGVFTLLLQVPVWLGILHQVGAFFLLAATTFTLHRYSK